MDDNTSPHEPDERLLDDRRRQREVLARIPDSELIPLPMTVPAVEDRLRLPVERRLRALFDELIGTEVLDVLEAAHVDEVTRQTKRVLEAGVDFITKASTAARVSTGGHLDLLAAHADSMKEDRTAEEHGNSIKSMKGEITKALALLAWADEVANDGYRDPRLVVDVEA